MSSPEWGEVALADAVCAVCAWDVDFISSTIGAAFLASFCVHGTAGGAFEEVGCVFEGSGFSLLVAVEAAGVRGLDGLSAVLAVCRFLCVDDDLLSGWISSCWRVSLARRRRCPGFELRRSLGVSECCEAW